MTSVIGPHEKNPGCAVAVLLISLQNQPFAFFLQTSLYFHRRIQDFFTGGLKDKFIRMCTDYIAVKSQQLR